MKVCLLTQSGPPEGWGGHCLGFLLLLQVKQRVGRGELISLAPMELDFGFLWFWQRFKPDSFSLGYSVGSWKPLSLGWGAFPTVIPIRQGLSLLAGLPTPSSTGDSSLGSLMWPFWVKPALLRGPCIHKEYSCTLCPGKPWSSGHSQLSTFLPSLLLTVDHSNGG